MRLLFGICARSTRELEGVAPAHSGELAGTVPGFAVALAWPAGE